MTPQTPATARPRLRNVQVLRGLAALLVVCGHTLAELGSRKMGNPYPFDENVIQFRFGVDVFFVISGFIMVYTTHRKSPGAIEGARFFRARFLRIAPLYWMVTLLAFCLAMVMPRAFNHADMGIGRLLASLFFLPYRNHGNDIFPIVGPGWTLDYEMFFYLLFALAMALPKRLAMPVLLSVMAVLAVTGILVPIAQPHLAFYLNPILLEFAAGIVLARLAIAGTVQRASRWAPVAIGAAIIWFAALHAVPFTDMQERYWVYGIPALLLVGGAVALDLVREEGPEQAQSHVARFFTALGDASYSIYLTHIFVVRALRIGLDRVAPHMPVPVFIAACLVVSVSVGMLVARTFEIPMHDLTRRLARRAAKRHATVTQTS